MLFFISNTRLKLAKNCAKAKQYPETELSVFENYLLSFPRYHPKTIEDILQNVKRNKKKA